jgi:8-oxo-dGTP pyrophosphatase MutT (NUDIX family)
MANADSRVTIHLVASLDGPARVRAAIRDEVASILPLDELEETHRSDTLAWIDSGATLCRTAKPATPPKHLEHPRETVVRELFEELKVVARHDITEPLMVTCTTTVGLSAGHVDVSLWYVVTVDRGQDIQFDRQEFVGAQWFSYSDVPTHRCDPHLKRFLAKLDACSAPRAVGDDVSGDAERHAFSK